MSKKACKKKKYSEPETGEYFCKKCNIKAIKEEKLCKPKKVE